MKLSTRLVLVPLLLLAQLSALAATITLHMGDNHQTTSRASAQPSGVIAWKAPQQSRIGVANYTAPSLTARALAPVLSVYPNPARGQVTVSVSQLVTKNDLKLRLSNIIGREIRTVAMRPEATEGGMSINLSDLPAGMYFYSLVQNDKVLSTKRLVLQN